MELMYVRPDGGRGLLARLRTIVPIIFLRSGFYLDAGHRGRLLVMQLEIYASAGQLIGEMAIASGLFELTGF
jgi:hypothetical protein